MMTFLERGHSCLEKDKNMGLIKYTKAKVKIPYDWIEIFECARQKPFPFDVVIKVFSKLGLNILNSYMPKNLHFHHVPLKN